MALNYAKSLPTDANGHDLQEFAAPYKPIIRYMRNNLTVSSVFTLNDNTTVVEISAVGTSVAIRWIPVTETSGVSPFASVITTLGSENFDHIIPANYYRRFVVPQEVAGVSSVVGLGVQAGTYRRLAVMSGAAVSSILVCEF